MGAISCGISFATCMIIDVSTILWSDSEYKGELI